MGETLERAVLERDPEPRTASSLHNKLHNAEISQSLQIPVNNCKKWIYIDYRLNSVAVV
jgi:hypothetical protein